MCVGRLCVGYRAPYYGSGRPDYVALISIFFSVFVIVWAALIVLLGLSELLNPGTILPGQSLGGLSPRSSTEPSHVRAKLLKEILRRRSRVSDKCPISTCPGGHSGDVCAICLEAIKPDELHRALPCNHRFHVDCIDSWIVHSSDADAGSDPHCPVCKCLILDEAQQDESASRTQGNVVPERGSLPTIGDAFV